MIKFHVIFSSVFIKRCFLRILIYNYNSHNRKFVAERERSVIFGHSVTHEDARRMTLRGRYYYLQHHREWPRIAKFIEYSSEKRPLAKLT